MLISSLCCVIQKKAYSDFRNCYTVQSYLHIQNEIIPIGTARNKSGLLINNKQEKKKRLEFFILSVRLQGDINGQKEKKKEVEKGGNRKEEGNKVLKTRKGKFISN